MTTTLAPAAATPFSGAFTAAPNATRLPGTPLARVEIETTNYVPTSKGALWWKKTGIDERQSHVSTLLDPYGNASAFSGSLADAVKAVKQLNTDEGFRNLEVTAGERTSNHGYWKGGEEYTANEARAIFRGSTPTEWIVQPVRLVLRGGATSRLELDATQGQSNIRYKATLTFHDADPDLVAVIDQKNLVEMRDRGATFRAEGVRLQPAKWVETSPPVRPGTPRKGVGI